MGNHRYHRMSISSRIPIRGLAIAAVVATLPAVALGQEAEIPAEEAAPAAVDPNAGRVANPVAEFAGLDKITGRIITFDVYIDETVQFGALQVTPRVCYSRPEAEKPKTDSFVEVDEITLDRKIRRIFTGWMFAESPGLNAVEHAVYDVWLKGCKQKSDVPAPGTAESARAPDAPDAEKSPEAAATSDPPKPE